MLMKVIVDIIYALGVSTVVYVLNIWCTNYLESEIMFEIMLYDHFSVSCGACYSEGKVH